MTIRPLIAALFVATASVPVWASNIIHSANDEIGYTSHPEHAQAGKTRKEVIAEMDQSKKDGTWAFHRLGAPVPVKAGPALTREQVLADLDRAQKHPSWSDRHVGSAVTMP